MYNLGHLGLYKNVPKKRKFNPTPNYEKDSYTLLQYKSHLRNEFLIPLKANGDGTGVATIRLQSLETQSVKITGNGKFYTTSAGTTEHGIESTIGTSLGSLYVKLPAGESCYLVLSKADKLKGLGSTTTNVIEDGANVPYINYCAINYPLINLSVIRFAGVLNSSFTGSIDSAPNLTFLSFSNNLLSSFTGSIDRTPNLTHLIFSNNLLSAFTGSIDSTPNLTQLAVSNNLLSAFTGSIDSTPNLRNMTFYSNPLSEITGDLGKAINCNRFNFGYNKKSKLLYDTPRDTIDKWSSGQLHEIYLSMASITTAMCDSLLIDIDASGATPTGSGLINLSGLCGAVTAASAAARTSLVNKGFRVIVNTQGE